MIKEYTKKDSYKILNIINDAAIKYKGIIPDDCLNEPYMSEQELGEEFSNGVHMFGFELNNKVHMFGYSKNNKLIGVIGVQEVKDVILIRHAYTLSLHQGKGVGSALLEYLLKKNKNSRLLVGTWKKATWAIRFYEKFGFIVHSKDETNLLLKKYWKIPSKQIDNSIVLEKA